MRMASGAAGRVSGYSERRTMTDDLTNKERIVLVYLSQMMEANARMIGEHIRSHGLKGGSNIAAIGAAVCGRLFKKRLVARISDLNAWRITYAGRAAIANIDANPPAGGE